jgi:uncharacterized protein YdeI (YjbR/CyaY-like superfamily)
MNPVYFKTATEFRAWLTEHHGTAKELWVGFYKKDSGLKGISYTEAVDEALCFGWIDGVKKRVDERSYTHRFSPRRPRSVWSRANFRRVETLRKLGRMTPAGEQAFAARDPKRSGVYSFENRPRRLDPPGENQFRAHPKAWDFFRAQPPGYQRTAVWWVLSAKKEETRTRRLTQLITDSEHGGRRALVGGKAGKQV